MAYKTGIHGGETTGGCLHYRTSRVLCKWLSRGYTDCNVWMSIIVIQREYTYVLGHRSVYEIALGHVSINTLVHRSVYVN